ncbi:MAG: hypothetical protein P1U46_03815 [Patescibacteria group bacterium]|nr:hypothetical protein [Patescibacteria group bacterium]
MAYVGLQLLKTGQREKPISTLHKNHFFCEDFHKLSFDFQANQIFVEKFFHKSGNIVISQKKTMIIQEKKVSIDLSKPIKRVVAFNKRENIIIEIDNETIII